MFAAAVTSPALEQKNRSKSCHCCWISCSVRPEWAREHISRVERWGIAKPHGQLPIRLENGTLKENSCPCWSFCLLSLYRRLIKLLQGTLASNAIQSMSDALQIKIERKGKDRWETVSIYLTIFDDIAVSFWLIQWHSDQNLRWGFLSDFPGKDSIKWECKRETSCVYVHIKSYSEANVSLLSVWIWNDG